MAVQRKSRVMLPLPSLRQGVIVWDFEAVIHRPQDRVAVEQRGHQHRLLLSAHIVADVTKESVDY